MTRTFRRIRLACLFLCVFVGAATANEFRLPLDDYPIDDHCLQWGGYNSAFDRCGLPGRHTADDACRPNGTDVFAVADGHVRLAQKVGTCLNNWGWLTVTEHTLANGERVCAIYGHCEPAPGMRAGAAVSMGDHIADIQLECGAPHIHFGIYRGPFDAPNGHYPEWLLGYLPGSFTCAAYPIPWPGSYVDPVAFIREQAVAVDHRTWDHIKRLYR